MKHLGLKEIMFTKLELPNDFPKRIAGPTGANAKAIARSFEYLPFFVHPPVVRPKGGKYEVVAGGDRVAAAYIAKQDRILCNVVELDDREMAKARIIENTHRRFDPARNDRELEQLTALVRGEIALEVQASGGEDADRPITAARERIAAAKNITVEGVRKAQQRAKARAKKAEKELQPTVPPEEVEAIKTFGLAMDRGWMEKVIELQRQTQRAYEASLTIKGAITRMQTQELPMVSSRWTHMRDDSNQLAELLRQSIPRSICPWCKGQPEFQDDCKGCWQQGFITEGQMKHVPAEMWDPGVCFHNGEIVPLPAAAEKVPEPQPAAKREPVVVPDSEDPFGDFP